MVIKESHYRGCKKQSQVDVNGYGPIHGLDFSLYYHTESEEVTPPVEDIVKARKVAGRYQANKPEHDVVITVSDSQDLPENSRNAPLKACETIGYDKHGFAISPKCRRMDPPEGLYNWKYMNDKEKDQLVIDARKEKFELERLARKKRR